MESLLFAIVHTRLPGPSFWGPPVSVSNILDLTLPAAGVSSSVPHAFTAGTLHASHLSHVCLLLIKTAITEASIALLSPDSRLLSSSQRVRGESNSIRAYHPSSCLPGCCVRKVPWTGWLRQWRWSLLGLQVFKIKADSVSGESSLPDQLIAISCYVLTRSDGQGNPFMNTPIHFLKSLTHYPLVTPPVNIEHHHWGLSCKI